ncbi:MAG: hypothetical protein ACO394_03760 [Blastocatellia bacterium]
MVSISSSSEFVSRPSPGSSAGKTSMAERSESLLIASAPLSDIAQDAKARSDYSISNGCIKTVVMLPLLADCFSKIKKWMMISSCQLDPKESPMYAQEVVELALARNALSENRARSREDRRVETTLWDKRGSIWQGRKG